jgi:hypothetical protein
MMNEEYLDSLKFEDLLDYVNNRGMKRYQKYLEEIFSGMDGNFEFDKKWYSRSIIEDSDSDDTWYLDYAEFTITFIEGKPMNITLELQRRDGYQTTSQYSYEMRINPFGYILYDCRCYYGDPTDVNNLKFDMTYFPESWDLEKVKEYFTDIYNCIASGRYNLKDHTWDDDDGEMLNVEEFFGSE